MTYYAPEGGIPGYYKCILGNDPKCKVDINTPCGNMMEIYCGKFEDCKDGDCSYIGASTRVVDRATGKIHYGKVPAYSVVVPGSMPSKNNPDGPSLYCVVIVKKVDEKTRSKTSINDLLRD